MKPVHIIPCLDIKDGRVVKGIKFENLVDVQDPKELALYYALKEGADELAFLDISASVEARKNSLSFLKEVTDQISIPTTVGGGISSVADCEEIFALGITKVSINSAALKKPSLIKELSDKYGKDRVMVAIDAKRTDKGNWHVYINGGQVELEKDAVEWAKEVESLGAGEIMLNSIDEDGEKKGYDIPLIQAIKKAVSIPVIASGGAGRLDDFLEGIQVGKADKVLAASVFHFGLIRIRELKAYLKSHGIAVEEGN